MRQSTRLVLNTGVSYSRMLVTIGFALVSTRLFVRALGHDDYGVFMLLFAAVGIVTSLTDALGASLMRHLAHRLGARDQSRARSEAPVGAGAPPGPRELVSSAAALVSGAALLLVVVCWLGRHALVGVYEIPAERVSSAAMALGLIGVRMGVVMIGSVFRAAAMARQAVPLIAVGDVLAALVIFAGALWLDGPTGASVERTGWAGDPLIAFGWLQVGAAVLVEGFVVTACVIRFQECRPRLTEVTGRAVREVLAFAGWTLAASGLQGVRLQGAPMLVNRAFGPAANTSWSLAGQVSGYIGVIGSTIIAVCAPALIGAHARGESLNERRLTLVVSKYACLAMVLIGVPAFCEMPTLLRLWLGEYPGELVLVARWLLLAPIATYLSMAHATCIGARGRTRELRPYTLLVHALDPLALVVAWAALRGAASVAPPTEPWMIPAAIVGVLALQSVVRAAYVGRLAGIRLVDWLGSTVIPVLLTGTVCLAAAWLVQRLLPEGLGRVAVTGLVCGTVFVPVAWLLALSPWERKAFRGVGGRSLVSLQAAASTGLRRPQDVQEGSEDDTGSR